MILLIPALEVKYEKRIESVEEKEQVWLSGTLEMV